MPKTQAQLPIVNITPLHQLVDGQEADFFALLSDKQELKTRDGKPYFRVTFRDAEREVSFPIWSDSPLAEPCRHEWRVGEFYKLRATLQESSYGLQLDIRKIRHVEESDRHEGFDPLMCQPSSRFDPHEMLDELLGIVDQHLVDIPVRNLLIDILDRNREQLLVLPAATRNHHAYVGGLLEHVLNVTRNCCYLADYYAELYNEMEPPLDKDLVIAGAILHDIGKLRELGPTPAGAEYTASGTLIGHIVQGRDIHREAAGDHNVDPEKLLRLEHLILSHQRLPEWGSPKPPMTPEAMIVHYADDLDAKLRSVATLIADDATDGPFTSGRNVLGNPVYRG